MATFDQRGQKVNCQYNAAGDINFGSVQHKEEAATELRKLQDEVSRAAQAGVLDAEVAVDVDSRIKKAVVQVEKPEPDKKSVLDYLREAKALIEGITSAAGLVTGLTQATEMIRKLL